MHAAPAVSVGCRDGGVWRAVQLGLHGLAGASVAAWLAAQGGLADAGQALAAAAAGLLGVAAAALNLRRRGRDDGQLVWDGQCWRHGIGADNAEAVPGRVRVALDLGGWLLLRFDGVDGPARWLALSRGAAGAAWPALRRALVATAGRPSLTEPG